MFPDSKVSLFFPPHAVLVSILLFVPTRQWWAYTLAAASAHFLATQQAHWPTVYTNVLRHARARKASVSLTTTAESVELNVVDDGVGFVAGERTRSGLGLRSINERVRFVRGSVSVDSRPGEGTKVLVRIPIGAAHNELVRGS